jgi:hypothetical protein
MRRGRVFASISRVMQDKQRIFDIDTAIKNMGNCQNQKVDCAECKMGKFIFDNNLKFREDELCKHEIVFLLAKVVKTFA